MLNRLSLFVAICLRKSYLDSRHVIKLRYRNQALEKSLHSPLSWIIKSTDNFSV